MGTELPRNHLPYLTFCNPHHIPVDQSRDSVLRRANTLKIAASNTLREIFVPNAAVEATEES